MTILREIAGQVEYKYAKDEIFQVTVALAGVGTKRVRIANLTPEIPNEVLRDATALWKGAVHIESWSKACRYAVSNGILQAKVVMNKHAPSHLTVPGYRVLLSYD
jgi:hypothetical protein